MYDVYKQATDHANGLRLLNGPGRLNDEVNYVLRRFLVWMQVRRTYAWRWRWFLMEWDPRRQSYVVVRDFMEFAAAEAYMPRFEREALRLQKLDLLEKQRLEVLKGDVVDRRGVADLRTRRRGRN